MNQSTQNHTALIVDDEPDIRELLGLTLQRMGVETLGAETVAEARELLLRQRFDLCLTDMRLPDGNGLELIRHIQSDYPDLPVAMITAHGNMHTAIESLKAGAFDFINKPVDLQQLRELVASALRTHEVSAEPHQGDREDGLTLLGQSPAMQALRHSIRKLARSQAPVYISGESGTGKELVARLIHHQGPRANHPFVAVNCGAIPSELMESELFGHKKGSFTGANSDKKGLFQAADGGTLFLDEVADLPLSMQVKLLRAIQEKAIRPVGGHEELHVDVRILSATHKNLSALVEQGEFREDLFYRLNVIQLSVPPLRERPEDIPVLAEHILQNLAQQTGEPPYRPSLEALQALQAYPFPGNVRELENTLERAITFCESGVLNPADLQLPGTTEGLAGTVPATPPTTAATITEQTEVRFSELPPVGSEGLEAYVEGVERELIRRALEACRYNKTAAAKQLGISFRALRYRLQKLGMD